MTDYYIIRVITNNYAYEQKYISAEDALESYDDLARIYRKEDFLILKLYYEDMGDIIILRQIVRIN